MLKIFTITLLVIRNPVRGKSFQFTSVTQFSNLSTKEDFYSEIFSMNIFLKIL